MCIACLGLSSLRALRDVSVRLGAVGEYGRENEGENGAGSSTDVPGAAWWVV